MKAIAKKIKYVSLLAFVALSLSCFMYVNLSETNEAAPTITVDVNATAEKSRIADLSLAKKLVTLVVKFVAAK